MVHLGILSFSGWYGRADLASCLLCLCYLLCCFFSILLWKYVRLCTYTSMLCVCFCMCVGLFLFTKLLSPMTEHMFVYLWSKYWFSKRWQHWKHQHHRQNRRMLTNQSTKFQWTHVCHNAHGSIWIWQSIFFGILYTSVDVLCVWVECVHTSYAVHSFHI